MDATAAMPLYFAYGANMDVPAMARRCPRSQPLGRARLAQHRFALTREGWANLVRDPRRTAHGLLWDLALSDVAALDRFEDVAGGLYSKAIQPVLRADAGPVQAMIYFANGDAPPGPSAPPAYLQAVVAAARAAELPQSYIASIEALQGPAKGASPRPAMPRTKEISR